MLFPIKTDFLEQFTPLQQRIASAAVMLLVLSIAISVGGFVFNALAYLVSLVAFYEWCGLFFKENKTIPKEILFAGGAVLTIVAFMAGVTTLSLPMILFILTIGTVGVLFVTYMHPTYFSPLLLGFGVPYIGLTMAILMYLRDSGLVTVDSVPVGSIVLLFLIVATTDTAAFFVGKNFGKNKLAPKISPNKTIEGLVGGVLGASIVSALFGTWLVGINPIILFVVTIPLAVIAQIGDLFESSLKRNIGKKDSGNIIPGHGGVLDRIDGILAVTPFYMLFLSLFL